MNENGTQPEWTAAAIWREQCEANPRRKDETFVAIPIEGDRPVVVTVRRNLYEDISTVLVEQGTVYYKVQTAKTAEEAYEEALAAVAHVRRMIGHGHIFRSDQQGVL